MYIDTLPRKRNEMKTVAEDKYLNDEIKMLSMGEIFADEQFNCRGFINPSTPGMMDLARNIQENGLIQPIVVRPLNGRFEVVAGFRRFLAHKLNNATHIKSIIRTDLDDNAAKFLNLSENLNRENLDIMQEANVVKAFYDDGFSREEIKDRLNVSRFWVEVRLKLKNLDPRIQEEVKAGWILQEHINAISSVKDPIKQLELVKDIKEHRQKDKGRVIVSKKSLKRDPNSKMKRTPSHIQQCIDHILENFGANLATRALAWANGQISSNEFFNDLEELADNDGLAYDRPTEDFK